jgi:cytoskeletal protein CcmA (bactofilin family)
MFSRTKEQEAPMIPQAQPAPKRPSKTGGVPSIISGDLIVHGTLISQGDVQVDGKVDGDIRAGSLVIGEKAVIIGDVYAEEAIVRGRVEGSIRARKVQLCATCHVEGNILHEALSMEVGAFFEGNCRHSDNPLADAPDGSSFTEKKSAPQSVRPAQPIASAQTLSPPKPVGETTQTSASFALKS